MSRYLPRVARFAPLTFAEHYSGNTIVKQWDSWAAYISSSMRSWAWLVSLLLCFIRPSSVSAVFADEAYQTDYHHPLLGSPQAHTTFFHRPSAASKASLLYTLSEKHVLGAVNPKDGTIVWRQLLADQRSNVTALGFLRAGQGQDTVVSAVENDIQAWDAADGRLVWAWTGLGQTKGLEVFEAQDGGMDILQLCEEEGGFGVIRKLAAATGEVIWEHRDARYADHLTGRSLDLGQSS